VDGAAHALFGLQPAAHSLVRLDGLAARVGPLEVGEELFLGARFACQQHCFVHGLDLHRLHRLNGQVDVLAERP
jgi:hypothetical protein